MASYSISSPEWLTLNPRTGKVRNAYSVNFMEHKSGFKNEPHSEDKSDQEDISSSDISDYENNREHNVEDTVTKKVQRSDNSGHYA